MYSTPVPVWSEWSDLRALFPAAERYNYLDHAAVGPASTYVRDAITHVADELTGHGLPSSAQLRERFPAVREALAAMVKGDASRIAFTQNTSAGLSIAAHGVRWRVGDNVVLPADEFPSNLYPWTNLERRGVQARLVARDDSGSAVDAIRAAIDSRTRVVAISAVQFSDGFRHDLADISAVCAEHDILFVVDGTQAVGAVEVDVAGLGIDVLAVAAHKWFLGPLGVGFVHLSDRAMERLEVDVVGWMSVGEPLAMDYSGVWDSTARRFEAGTENTAGVFGLGAAADLFLSVGTGKVESRILHLTAHAIAEADAAGMRVLSARADAHRSGIVVVAHPDEDPAVSRERLVASGILCSARGGGVRLAPHFYNTEDELSAAISALAAL